MSKNFEKVKQYYDDKKWSKEAVYKAVTNPINDPWITAEEYKDITDEEYV